MDGALLSEPERWATMRPKPELKTGLLKFGSAIVVHRVAQTFNLSWSKLLPFEREEARIEQNFGNQG